MELNTGNLCLAQQLRHLPRIDGMKVNATVSIHSEEEWDRRPHTRTFGIVVHLKVAHILTRSQVKEHTYSRGAESTHTLYIYNTCSCIYGKYKLCAFAHVLGLKKRPMAIIKGTLLYAAIATALLPFGFLRTHSVPGTAAKLPLALLPSLVQAFSGSK